MGSNIIKKLVPFAVKKYIKDQIGTQQESKATEYVLHINDQGKLSGKRVIVTGGTGAIGSAVCHRLYLERATVGVCGRNMDKVHEMIARFQNENFAAGGTLIPLYLDVTDLNSVEDAVDQFVEQTNGLDAFINNAGGGARKESKKIYEQSLDVIDRVININLRGSIICARKAAQIMVKQDSGIILNMSSVVGMRGKDKMSDYAAAKAGIIGFTKSLAIELGTYNIRVNCISPGMVNQIPFDAGMPVRKTDTNCFGRFGYTDEVADVVAFLLSDDSRYITGQNIVVDGGRTLGLMGD